MLILILMVFTMFLMIFDIGAKILVENNITRGEEHDILDGNVKLRKVYNEGICFNLFDEHQKEVGILSSFVTVILTIYQLLVLMQKKHYLKKLGLSLMTAGAWSNTLDRVTRHYVVDYFSFKTKWKKLNDLTFNLADIFVITGSLLLMISSLFHKKK
ncbi:MAG: signal peptidase II [Hespellia sp.]|nr:signal peptidase II [Hespellia sp.]